METKSERRNVERSEAERNAVALFEVVMERNGAFRRNEVECSNVERSIGTIRSGAYGMKCSLEGAERNGSSRRPQPSKWNGVALATEWNVEMRLKGAIVVVEIQRIGTKEDGTDWSIFRCGREWSPGVEIRRIVTALEPS